MQLLKMATCLQHHIGASVLISEDLRILLLKRVESASSHSEECIRQLRQETKEAVSEDVVKRINIGVDIGVLRSEMILLRLVHLSNLGAEILQPYQNTYEGSRIKFEELSTELGERLGQLIALEQFSHVSPLVAILSAFGNFDLENEVACIISKSS